LEEHGRLLRALQDSLERESELQRGLRRLKEGLTVSALKMQVAVKMVNDDDATIQSLRKDAEDARKQAIIATKDLEEATNTIQDLRLELGALKRKLAEVQDVEGRKDIAFVPPPTQEETDREVDVMMRLQDLKMAESLGGRIAATATPFQEWKMNRLLYSEDTPAGSKHADSDAVELLSEYAYLESINAVSSNGLQKPNKASVVKSRKQLSTAEGSRSRKGTSNMDFRSASLPSLIQPTQQSFGEVGTGWTRGLGREGELVVKSALDRSYREGHQPPKTSSMSTNTMGRVLV